MRDVLDVVADLGPVTPGLLCATVGEQVVAAAEAVEAVHQLRQMGVLVPLRRLGAGGPLSVVPVVAGVLAGQRQTTVDADLLRAAALAYEEEGLAFPACQSYARAGDWSAVERLVAERGEDMLRQGDARGVADLLGRRPAVTWPPLVQRIHADALAISRRRGRRPSYLPTALRRGGPRRLAAGAGDRGRHRALHAGRLRTRAGRRSTGSTPMGSRPTCTASSGAPAG